MSTLIDRLGSDTAIDLDIFVGIPLSELLDLGHAALDELLAAASWFAYASASESSCGDWRSPDGHAPGCTVMTRIMSTSAPTSSVMAVEGVSGEMAIPAFILRS